MLKIGKLTINSKVLLAPMCGITDAPFRKIVKICAPDILTFSEMIASDAAIHEHAKTIKRAKHNCNESIPAVQIAGYCPESVYKASLVAIETGAKIIDLNFGCPVKKIVNNFSGSALMKDISRMKQIINSAFKACNQNQVELTIKTRMGWDNNNLNAPEIAKMAEEEGVSMITIHGRTRAQMFNGQADWNFVKQVKQNVKIPVIVNGDIKNPMDATLALELSNADGIMIGRAVQGQPWIMNIIDNHLKKIPHNSYIINSEEKKFTLILQHLQEMIEHYGKISALGFIKKHLSWYCKGYKNSASFRSDINSMHDVDLIIESFIQFYQNQKEEIYS